MANEPSLSEITNINVNPLLGGGESTPVIDNSKLVDTLNQNARYHAENTWRKYKQFLENKTELFKNISEIQGLDTAQQDRDLLKGQAADILGQIAKDPSIVMGGQGYSELQGKIAKFKADAMTSKQDKVDDELNAKFMAANPELMSDDNTAMRQEFWKAPLGARKPVMLKMPTIFDEKTAVEGLIKGATTETEQVVGKDGKPGGEGYIAKMVTIDPEKVRTGWNMIVKGGQQDKNAHDLVLAVQERYNKLPEREKAKYDAEGGIEKYWADKGDQYLKAYFPDGKYSFVKDLQADPNYLDRERLDLEKDKFKHNKAVDKEQLQQGWARIGIDRDRAKKIKDTVSSGALSVLQEAAGVINNAEKVKAYNPVTKEHGIVYRISDPNLLQKFSNVDKDGKTTNVADFINFDAKTEQPILVYLKRDRLGKPIPGSYDREIPVDQRTWLKVIAATTAKGEDVGEVNVTVDEALTLSGGILNIAKKLKKVNQSAPAQTPAQTAPSKTTKKGLPVF